MPFRAATPSKDKDATLLRRLGQDLRTHWPAAALFLVFWLAVWGITAATWLFADGQPMGMHPLATLLHLLLPFVAGAMAGWWRQAPAARPRGLRAGAGFGLLAGVLVMEANLAILFAGDAIMAARLGLDTGPPLDALVEVVDFGLLFGVIGVVQGAAGGLVAGLLAAGVLAAALRRVRGR